MTTLLEEVRISRSLPPPHRRREIRRCAGVSRQRLAQELNVHPCTIGRWERGHRVPRGDLRLRYARLLVDLASVPAP
jgi:transcriptional regulator with XRE-family HTH domain